jgi:hypothetical protein
VNFAEPLKPKAAFKERERRVELVVEAKGMAPLQQTVHLLAPTNDVTFVLPAGRLFRGRIVDESGVPMPGAVIRTDYDFDNQVEAPVRWMTYTDEGGRFEWDSAPAQPICFWFEASGYEVIRGRRIQPDGTHHEITLKKKPDGAPPR